MENNKKATGEDFFETMWKHSWTYVQTVVDIMREPILILDKHLCVLAANERFYEIFKVDKEETEGNVVYELGNGQWNIPSLKKLLEDILPKHTFFKGYEVDHQFPTIGRKIMILNARQIYFNNKDEISEKTPSIMLLAIEDVTEMVGVAETLANHTNQFEEKVAERTGKLEIHIKELEKELDKFKKTKND